MRETGAVTANLERVRETIARAARKGGRSPEAVGLVAVTKLVPPDLFLEAVRAGVTDLGENRVQEGVAKRQAVEAAGLDAGAGPVRWHLIGHLQTNKAARAARYFEIIHSVDSLRVAEALSLAVMRERAEDSRADAATAPSPAEPGAPSAGAFGPLEVLLEINVSGEATKYGVPPGEAPDLARAVARLPGLALRGLMTVAPLVSDPEDTRPVFRRLASLRREIHALGLPGVTMDCLSMGMSQDYEVAVAEGATLVRIGTAIFGPRGG